MAFKKFGVLCISCCFLINLDLFCVVLTQEVEPAPLAEQVEYQNPTGDNQQLVHAVDSVPSEIQEPPIIALHQSEPNEIDEALKALNEPSFAVNQDQNEPQPNAVNQEQNVPVVVNQLPDGVNEAINVQNHPQNVADQVPIAANELPNVVNQPPNTLSPDVVNQPPSTLSPDVVNQPPSMLSPHLVNQPSRTLSPDAVNQPPRVHVYSQHKPSTVEFDFGSVDSAEVYNDFESVPGVQHEFRIEVAAGKSECIYQRLVVNAQLHVSFQVLRGLDRNIGFLIQGPGNLVLEHVEWLGEASFQKVVPVEGLYRFCLNNEISKFSSKLVYFYMVTYIEEKWHLHSRNIVDFFGGAEDIQQSLDTVDDRVKKMHIEQANSRRNVITDWYLIQDNNSYVQIMSLILCVVIVASSAFQVFFVRHLFNVKNVTAKVKSRA